MDSFLPFSRFRTKLDENEEVNRNLQDQVLLYQQELQRESNESEMLRGEVSQLESRLTASLQDIQRIREVRNDMAKSNILKWSKT